MCGRQCFFFLRFGGLMPLFLIYLYFIDWDIQFITLVPIVEAHSNIFTAAAQKRDLHWGAEPGIEPGPAVQQADALLFELRRTLFELRRTLIWAAPHPCTYTYTYTCISTDVWRIWIWRINVSVYSTIVSPIHISMYWRVYSGRTKYSVRTKYSAQSYRRQYL